MWQWCSGCTLIHAGMNTEVSGLPWICPPTHQAVPPRCWVMSRVVHDSLPAGGCLSPRAKSLLAGGLHLQLDTHAPLIIHTTLCLVHCMINYTEKHLLLLLFRILYSIWVLEYFYICGEIEIIAFKQLLEKCKWLNSLCVLPSVSTTWQTVSDLPSVLPSCLLFKTFFF